MEARLRFENRDDSLRGNCRAICGNIAVLTGDFINFTQPPAAHIVDDLRMPGHRSPVPAALRADASLLLSSLALVPHVLSIAEAVENMWGGVGGNRFVGLRVANALDKMPGLDLHVINRTGQRIGYGAGYYDMTIGRLRTMKPVHDKIRAAKAAELERVRNEIGAQRAAAASDAAAATRLQGLLAYEARIEAAPEWPFDQTTLVRVGASALILTVPWFGQAIAGYFIEHLAH